MSEASPCGLHTSLSVTEVLWGRWPPQLCSGGVVCGSQAGNGSQSAGASVPLRRTCSLCWLDPSPSSCRQSRGRAWCREEGLEDCAPAEPSSGLLPTDRLSVSLVYLLFGVLTLQLVGLFGDRVSWCYIYCLCRRVSRI